MSKRRVQLHGQAGFAAIDDAATVGAQIGVNVFDADGTSLFVPLTRAQVEQMLAGNQATLWELVQKVPPNVRALENAAGTGLFAVTAAGTGAFRELQGAASVEVTDGDGVAGDPALALVNDDAAPGASKYYGTDASSVKGFHALPAGGDGLNPYADYLVDSDGNYLVDSAGNYLTTDNDGFPIPQAYGGTGVAGGGSKANFLRGDGSYSTDLVTTISPALQLIKYSNDAAGPQFRFIKYRGTEAVPAACQAGDNLIPFQARGGLSTAGVISESGNVGAYIIKAAEGFTNTALGTYGVLQTTPIGSTAAADQYTFNDTAFTPATDNTRDQGSASLRYANVYGRQFRPGAGTPIWTSGTGTPEGAVTAPVGSLFTRTDGGASTTLYVKESGAGNTGWVAK